jgi:tetratricopeptide (TPR) repeat protein
MIPESYEALNREAEEAFVHGELDRARSLLRRSEEDAASSGFPDLADKAYCRRCYVELEGECLDHESELPRLQEILVRSQDPVTSWMAAHYSALSFYQRSDRDQAQEYGKQALAIAERMGDQSRAAASINLFGTIAAQTSKFEEAEKALRKALGWYAGDSDHSNLMKAQLHDNLGYVLLCTARLDDGIEQCLQAKQLVEDLDADHFLPQILQDLCFGYLQLKKLDEANLHGERGLELALAYDDKLIIKNLCFLLAEIAVRRGDREHARFLLTNLTRYFPDVPEGEGEDIISLMLGVDLTQIVNLRD